MLLSFLIYIVLGASYHLESYVAPYRTGIFYWARAPILIEIKSRIGVGLLR